MKDCEDNVIDSLKSSCFEDMLFEVLFIRPSIKCFVPNDELRINYAGVDNLFRSITFIYYLLIFLLGITPGSLRHTSRVILPSLTCTRFGHFDTKEKKPKIKPRRIFEAVTQPIYPEMLNYAEHMNINRCEVLMKETQTAEQVWHKMS